MPAYGELLEKGRRRMETDLWNGEYFVQKVQWKGLRAGNPQDTKSMVGEYSPEALALLDEEGPKYQYGDGCLSDGVLGEWMAAVCGMGDVLDREKTGSHLRAVHRHNLQKDLSDHANPQRPTYACGAEGGLLLCTWPRGGALALPFVYSNEVWTGIEYQVASHLMLMGMVEEGLEIVRTCRDRYDGRVRNPFDEYECGHWYARAMSSYGLIQGLTGVRYDAVERVLHVEPRPPRGLPELPLHGHRLRHGRRALRQAVPRGALGHDRRRADRLPAPRLTGLPFTVRTPTPTMGPSHPHGGRGAEFLGAWFAYLLCVSYVVAFVCGQTLSRGTPYMLVFRVAGAVALAGYSFGQIPNAIWWGRPWKSTLKEFGDGVVYALLTAGCFGWLWPE